MRYLRPVPTGSASPPRVRGGPWQRIARLFRTWWSHRVSFAISMILTASAVLIYLFTFVGERATPFFEFVQRLELNTLDTRFRYRGRSHGRPDSRIVIVDIDQHSQEVLGRWPFSRTHFANMLDALREDGARVVAFDITFSKPDEISAPISELRKEFQGQGGEIDPRFAAKFAKLEAKYNTDEHFARAIERFGTVVLGNFFLYSDSDLAGIDDETLDRYAALLSFFPFPRVQPQRPETAREDLLKLVRNYENLRLLPKGAQANLEIFNDALRGDRGATGFFSVPADTDGVVRHSLLALPYGRSNNPDEWDIFASLDVQAARLYLQLSNDQTALRYGPAGIVDLHCGSSPIPSAAP